MKKKIFLFTLTCIQLFSYGQDNDSNQHKFGIKWSPLNIIDPINPSFQVAFIYMPGSSRFNYQLEGGLILNQDVISAADSNFTGLPPNNKGFKIRAEVQYWKKPESINTKSGLYYAAELMFTDISATKKFGYKTKDTLGNDATTYTDTIFAEKIVFGINLKLGLHKTFNSGFFIDTYIGLGVKLIDVKQTGRTNPNDDYFFNVDEWGISQTAYKAGNRVVPNLPLNFKIGYLF